MESLDPQESMPVPPTPTSVAPVPERTSTQDSDNDAWRRRKQAKVTFNKTLNGRYGNGPTGYSKVGVLLIYWEGDNARFEQEAKLLEAVFRDDYGFCTTLYAIPSSQDSPTLSARRLEARLYEWANEYNSPDKLSIIYYGGHGRKNGHSMQISHGSTDGGIFQVEAADLLRPLNVPDTDTLLIVDCCYAAHAFSKNQQGKRKFELLSCVPAEEQALGPGHASSFSVALKWALTVLRDEYKLRGFTTSDLYRKVYFKSPLPKKPFLFDCSSKNYGNIKLVPFPPKSGTPAMTPDPEQSSPVFVDLRFQLSMVPNQSIMQELASHMQYIPYVHKMEFKNLSAPEAKLQDFMEDVIRAQRIKPLLKKIRVRREAIRINRQKEDGMQISPIQRQNSFGPLPQRNSELHDWTPSQGLEEEAAAKEQTPQIIQVVRIATDVASESKPQESTASPIQYNSPPPLEAISDAETSDSTEWSPGKKKRNSPPLAFGPEESRMKRPRKG
ncbi:hypothetical protein IWZ01DRAFT_540104 [Phyllosticta capitalensis]